MALALDPLLQTYFDVFCARRPLDDMRAVLHANVQVRGPFLAVDDVDAYVAALAADTPRPPLHVDVRQVTVQAATTTVHYVLQGEGRADLDVVQRFEVHDGRITHMTLQFDTTQVPA